MTPEEEEIQKRTQALQAAETALVQAAAAWAEAAVATLYRKRYRHLSVAAVALQHPAVVVAAVE